MATDRISTLRDIAQALIPSVLIVGFSFFVISACVSDPNDLEVPQENVELNQSENQNQNQTNQNQNENQNQTNQNQDENQNQTNQNQNENQNQTNQNRDENQNQNQTNQNQDGNQNQTNQNQDENQNQVEPDFSCDEHFAGLNPGTNVANMKMLYPEIVQGAPNAASVDSSVAIFSAYIEIWEKSADGSCVGTYNYEGSDDEVSETVTCSEDSTTYYHTCKTNSLDPGEYCVFVFDDSAGSASPTPTPIDYASFSIDAGGDDPSCDELPCTDEAPCSVECSLC